MILQELKAISRAMGYDPVKRLEEIESLTAKLKLTVTTEYHDALMHDWHTEVVELQEQLEKRIKDYVDLAIEVESLKLRLHVGGQRKKLLEAVYEAAKLTVQHIPFCDDHGLALTIAAVQTEEKIVSPQDSKEFT